MHKCSRRVAHLGIFNIVIHRVWGWVRHGPQLQILLEKKNKRDKHKYLNESIHVPIHVASGCKAFVSDKNRFTQNHVMLHGLTSAVRKSRDRKGLEITWQGKKRKINLGMNHSFPLPLFALHFFLEIKEKPGVSVVKLTCNCKLIR